VKQEAAIGTGGSATNRTEGSRWTVVIGALIVQVILGTVYAFSVFVAPLEQEFGWSRTTTQWAFSLALATFAISMIPAGRLQDRLGPRRVATIGGLLLGVSFLLGALLVNGDRPWALFLTYGVIGGAGIGFGYVCPIAASVKWFPDKKGLITGLAVAGFGAGALFFAGPASALLLPREAGADGIGLGTILLIGLGVIEGDGSGIGWRMFFVLHGVVAAAAVMLGAMLLRNPPTGWHPPGWQPSAVQIERANRDLDWHAMLDTPLACMLWLTFIFGATSGLMAIGQWKPMMAIVLEGQTFAPTWLGGFGRFVEPVAVLAIFNALGRIFWGRVSDVIDRPRTMMMMFLAQGMAFMMLVSVQSPVAIFVASAWVGLNFGGNFALFPSATSDYFGSKHFGVNYGWIFTAYGVAGVLGPVVGGVLFDATGQYTMAFVFAGILCFLAAGSAVVVWGLARANEGRVGAVPTVGATR
jgi:OFA family oxalate/formate antiporter-like MFS transporter